MTTIVYVWANSPSDAGHVSMQVNQTYMSFWPGSTANAKKDIKTGTMHHASFSTSYQIDCRVERKQADDRIYLNKLDEKVIIDCWQTLQAIAQNTTCVNRIAQQLLPVYLSRFRVYVRTIFPEL